MGDAESVAVLDKKYTRRTFIKGVIAVGATASTANYFIGGAGTLGAQTMPGGPLVLRAYQSPGRWCIRTDHTNHPAGHTSGLCESAVTMGGLRLQGQILGWIWSAVLLIKKRCYIFEAVISPIPNISLSLRRGRNFTRLARIGE